MLVPWRTCTLYLSKGASRLEEPDRERLLGSHTAAQFCTVCWVALLPSLLRTLQVLMALPTIN